jgi:hypothetical protein
MQQLIKTSRFLRKLPEFRGIVVAQQGKHDEVSKAFRFGIFCWSDLRSATTLAVSFESRRWKTSSPQSKRNVWKQQKS